MTPNSRFNDFIKDINPSTTTSTRSQAAHKRVRSVLEADEDYKEYFIRSFLAGSYKRSTAIRPVTRNGETERPDVDIYVVVTGTIRDEPEDSIDDLFETLNRNRKELKIQKLARNRCSIKMETNDAAMDVTPLLERQTDGLYRVGDRETNEWHQTDPEGHTEWSAKQNSDFDGRFNATVKMLKWARRENRTSYRKPKSFSLEAFVADEMPQNENHYGKIAHAVFDGFVERYALHRAIESCPTLQDPSVPNGNLLNGVSGEAFCAYYDKIKSHRDDAEKALETEDQEEATKLWRKIFGDRFPSGNSASREKKAAAVMSPLAFPDEPLTPPNKPAGFA